MINIDNIILESEITKSSFCCDLPRCKGGCCTFPGEYGAPLLDEEVPMIMNALDTAFPYLSERSINYIKDEGFIQGEEGDYTTMCIEKKDCVFVFYKGDIAFCGLEAAYFDGKSDFRKPISCHLFPIRVGSFDGDYLYYEKIPECAPGVMKGRAENISLVECLRDPLVRAYGEEWYAKLLEAVKSDKGY
ncbi:MAG: DUF3109 family protein [Chloroflexota bacterium]